jgi:hypothetical protein
MNSKNNCLRRRLTGNCSTNRRARRAWPVRLQWFVPNVQLFQIESRSATALTAMFRGGLAISGPSPNAGPMIQLSPARRGATRCPLAPRARRKASQGARRSPRNRAVEAGERRQVLFVSATRRMSRTRLIYATVSCRLFGISPGVNPVFNAEQFRYHVSRRAARCPGGSAIRRSRGRSFAMKGRLPPRKRRRAENRNQPNSIESQLEGKVAIRINLVQSRCFRSVLKQCGSILTQCGSERPFVLN